MKREDINKLFTGSLTGEVTKMIDGFKKSLIGHSANNPTKRSWRITVKDGVYKLPTPDRVGTKPGLRYHSKQVRRAGTWAQFKEARAMVGGDE